MHRGSEAVIANFGLLLAKTMLAVAVALFILISPKQKTDDGIKPKVEMIITVEWNGTINADVDTWIKTPTGDIVWYNGKEAGFTSIERDVLGTSNNAVLSGQPISQELTTIRGIESGEYIINLHVYNYDGNTLPRPLPAPLPVVVTITRMNPRVWEVFRKEIVLTEVREEQHVVRMTVEEDGRVSSLDADRPVLIRKERAE